MKTGIFYRCSVEQIQHQQQHLYRIEIRVALAVISDGNRGFCYWLLTIVCLVLLIFPLFTFGQCIVLMKESSEDKANTFCIFLFLLFLQENITHTTYISSHITIPELTLASSLIARLNKRSIDQIS